MIKIIRKIEKDGKNPGKRFGKMREEIKCKPQRLGHSQLQ